jgi:hypothetical protein
VKKKLKGKKKLADTSRRSLLAHAKKEEMLAILIRNLEAFKHVRDTVRSGYFARMGVRYSTLWRCVTKFVAKYGELPPIPNLRAQLHQEIADKPDYMDHEELLKLDEFLDYANDPKSMGPDVETSSLQRKVAIDICKQFCEECIQSEIQSTLIEGGTIPSDLVKELDKHKQQLEIVSSLTDISLDVAYPEGWDENASAKLFTTGSNLLDNFSGGGWKAGEVFLFMAPYGTCKTLLTCHCAAGMVQHCGDIYSQARIDWLSAVEKDPTLPEPKRPVAVVIFTEGSKHDYRVRIMSNLATVPWSRLSQMNSLKDLCQAPVPGATDHTKYELKEFDLKEGEEEAFECERDRVQHQVVVANRYLVMIDCTDSDTDSPHRIGRGGIPELAGIISKHFEAHKDTYPVAVYLDHASALADRMAQAAEVDIDDSAFLRLTLKRIPLQCRDRIGVPFHVPVLVMHQLSGKANAKSASATQHHTDGADAKSIGEYVDFAIVGGQATEDNVLKLTCSKHRREPPCPHRYARIRGQFNRLIDETPDHVSVGKDLIPKSDNTAYNANHGKKKASETGSVSFGEHF